MKTKMIGLIAIVVTLAAISATAMPVSAAQDLRITNHNLYALDHLASWVTYGSGGLLPWGGYPSILDVNYQGLRMVGNIRATTVADHNGWYLGECVSFAKALSKSTVATGSWSRGSKVMTSNIAPGTVIAKFNADGSYDSWGRTGHAAIFRGHTFSNGRRTGILVWDQNYLPNCGGVVARHAISASGSGVNNANNYYVVRV